MAGRKYVVVASRDGTVPMLPMRTCRMSAEAYAFARELKQDGWRFVAVKASRGSISFVEKQ